jgi:signal transduction histidine kinase
MAIISGLVSILGSHHCQLGIIALGALLCYYPIIFGVSSNMENSTVRESLMSNSFRESSFAILSLCLVFALDFLADHLSTIFAKNSFRASMIDEEQPKIIVDSEKVVCFFGVLVVPLLALLPASTSNIALLYMCSYHSQQILIGGFVVVMCGRYYKPYFPTWCIASSLSCFIISSLVDIWAMNAYQEVTAARTIPYYLELISTGPVLICMLIWIVFEFVMRLALPWLRETLSATVTRRGSVTIGTERSPDALEVLRRKHKEDIMFFPALYTLAAVFCMFYFAVAYAEIWDLYEIRPEDLMGLNVPVLILQIVVLVFSAQFAKYEAVDYLYALFDSKKSYARYISHELRAPMNVACMGLNRLLSEVGHFLEASTEEEREQIATLADINQACTTAVDILNDLLCFEKLESGILEIDEEEVRIRPFVKECLGMFALSARNKGVKLVCDFSAYFGTISPLTEGDFMRVDRFKLSQVIRNLISNAVKFTPYGGTVTVRAYCVKPSPPYRSRSQQGLRGRVRNSVIVPNAGVGEAGGGAAGGGPDMELARQLEDALKDQEEVEGPQESVKERGNLVIEVIDTGFGMSESLQRKLLKKVGIPPMPIKLSRPVICLSNMWYFVSILFIHLTPST